MMKPIFISGPSDDITDVPGLKVGHWTDLGAVTGCTVILCEKGPLAAVDVRGGAPATHELGALSASSLIQRCHAILFTGGSAFGLESASGAAQFLSEHEIGFETRVRHVPIIPSAAIFDLGIGSNDVSPGVLEGYKAAQVASSGSLEQGSVGAGTGATVAKFAGPERSLKGGVGSASLIGPNGIVVACLVVTNALGSIYDSSTGEIVAAPRNTDGRYLSLEDALSINSNFVEDSRQNTTLVCVATNASLSHMQVQRLTVHAHDGLARAIFPVHTLGDGDIAFSLATCEKELGDEYLLMLAILTTSVVERAIIKSVQRATTIAEIPSVRDWVSSKT